MPSAFAKRNLFSHRWADKKLSMDLGTLVPFFHQEVYPGDFWKLNTNLSVKMADFGQPVFDSLTLKLWYMYVPHRTVIADFEQFITGWDLKQNKDSTVLWPYITMGANTTDNWKVGSLADYLEVPVTQNITGGKVSAVPFRVYQKICNDWFISEFLQDQIIVSDGSGEDTTTDLTLKNRCWPRDYFTQALPFVQLGAPVMIPLAGEVPVYGNGKTLGLMFYNQAGQPGGAGLGYSNTDNQVYSLLPYISLYDKPAGTEAFPSTPAPGYSIKGVGLSMDPSTSGLVANLSNVQGLNVNVARLGFQMQRIQERLARSGVRLTEYIRSVFAVFPPDARLQRAEYLGGGRCPVMISEVIQNSATTEGSTQGNRTAIGDAYNSIPTITKGFTEHGTIMGLMSVLPVPTYFQGLRRDMFGTRTRFDLLQPELAHIGEQPLFNAELYYDASAENNMGEFGYIPQYQWFREFKSSVCADFRTSMRNFFFGREFSQLPVLNEDFVVAKPSSAPFAAGAKNATRPIWVDVLVVADIVRCLPKKGTPGLIDH